MVDLNELTNAFPLIVSLNNCKRKDVLAPFFSPLQYKMYSNN